MPVVVEHLGHTGGLTGLPLSRKGGENQGSAGAVMALVGVQGCLAHKKTPPPRTLQQGYA